MIRRGSELVASGEAVFAVSADLRIVSWNGAAAELTGIRADEALGQPCWLVLRGRGARGATLCHSECALNRYAREGWGVPRHEMTIATRTGARDVSVSTVLVNDRPEPLLVHVLHDGAPESAAAAVPHEPVARLTPRQLQVLRLLAEGVTAREIAGRLALAETTVRNHIRAILGELGAHSQLEAVASARRQGIV